MGSPSDWPAGETHPPPANRMTVKKNTRKLTVNAATLRTLGTLDGGTKDYTSSNDVSGSSTSGRGSWRCD